MLPVRSVVARGMVLRPALVRGAAARGMATVAVGVSGGVDSSVVALMLRDEGHDVVGVHMSNWNVYEESDGRQAECAQREASDARRVCERLGIGFKEVSFVCEYWQEVFDIMLQGYHNGGTPNPDVLCNRHIKFDRFVNHALALGAEWVATGHYARLDRGDAGGAVRLLTAADEAKDQSYFLSQVHGDLNILHYTYTYTCMIINRDLLWP